MYEALRDAVINDGQEGLSAAQAAFSLVEKSQEGQCRAAVEVTGENGDRVNEVAQKILSEHGDIRSAVSAGDSGVELETVYFTPRRK
jgi:hypothetical protein